MRLDVVSFSPSPDAVQEMHAQTNAFDAEYGHSGAAFVNVSTKSGTNTLHGTVYEYHRNDNLSVYINQYNPLVNVHTALGRHALAVFLLKASLDG